MNNFVHGFLKIAFSPPHGMTEEEYKRALEYHRIGKVRRPFIHTGMNSFPGAHDSDNGAHSVQESIAGNSATMGTSGGVTAGASAVGGTGGAGS